MPIDKSPPWKAISWAEKYPNDSVEPPEWAASGLQYWMVETTAGHTVSAEWMTEEQARTIAAAPELLASIDPDTLEAIADEIECFEHSARCGSLRSLAKQQRAALAKATVLP